MIRSASGNPLKRTIRPVTQTPVSGGRTRVAVTRGAAVLDAPDAQARDGSLEHDAEDAGGGQDVERAVAGVLGDLHAIDLRVPHV